MPRNKRSVARVRRQGSLDGLCGVYSVINAVVLTCRPSSEDVQDLFRTLCQELESEGRLADVLAGGMTVRTLGKLIDAAGRFLSDRQSFTLSRMIAFCDDPVPLATSVTCLQCHANEKPEERSEVDKRCRNWK